MLTTLRIRNLALVTDLTLELPSGYNAITGETGAGKSILIGALKIVLGGRADRSMIRTDSDGCSVEAVFDITTVQKQIGVLIEEYGLEPCEGDQLILKRAIASNGVNRQYVNGSPTTVQVLSVLGQWLVDFHGPHDHQSLLHPARQLAILDAFGDLGKWREAFVEVLTQREALEAKKSSLVIDEKAYAQQLDLLRFQANEIATARLRADEEAEVEAEYQRASNASKLLELSRAALDVLSESEDSVLTRAGVIGRTLQELNRIDSGAACALSLQEQAMQNLREMQGELSHYAEKIDLNPTRLAELEERLNLIHSLKRKYGSTLADVISFGDQAAEKLQLLEHRDEELSRLNADIHKINAELQRAGVELSTRRKKLLPKLSKAVAAQLNELGFKQSHFEIEMKSVTEAGEGEGPNDGGPRLKNRVSNAGFDQVEFQFAPNPGEAPRPLRAIASSGEMARVMLALKTVLAAEDEIPVLIFDEVDANVGGETASAVGQKMWQIAQQRQVLCITHLPQVAASASTHFVVTKQVRDNRTISEITPLKGPERINEVARMLGGQSEAARKHARSLLRTNDR